MRILVTGATGFIGRHLTAALIAAGHDVACCLRDTARARRAFPRQDAIPCDFGEDIQSADWLPRLAGVEAVVNCVGALHSRHGESLEAIQVAATSALFDACVDAGVRRVVHVSALGVDGPADTEYARTKRAADEYLQTLALDWTILRPSLAYTPSGSFGGTSLFRAMAATPFCIPVVGRGEQAFQPIHMDDLAGAVREVVENGAARHKVVEAVGPEPMSIRRILTEMRAWLGLPPAPVLQLPRGLVMAFARFGDLFGSGPITTTSLRMMEQGNTADPAPFRALCGSPPRTMAAVLAENPAHVQDRWHARLYFLRPLLRLVLAAFWIATGLITAFGPLRDQGLALLTEAGFGPAARDWVLWGTCALDVLLGALMLLGWHVRLVAAAQLLAIFGYLAAASLVLPDLWWDPLGPLLKLLPIVVATLVVMALADDK